MQEIVLLLSSLAGVASAAAVKKFPNLKGQISNIGANPQIQTQIHSLKVEKEILTKTIARLYQNDSGLTKIQRDRLLLKYQHQLGIILAKIEKLEASSKHPDLGPLGDGLVTLMDQKLSSLDKRLYDLSAKISVANAELETKKEVEKKISKIEKPPIKIKNSKPNVQTKTIEKPKEVNIPQIEIDEKPLHPFEITTLTEIPNKPFDFPLTEQEPKNEIIEEILQPKENIKEKIEIVQSVAPTIVKPEIKPESKPIEPQIKPQEIKEKFSHISAHKALPEPEKPSIKLPQDENIEEENDDLDKIKSEIMKTLSKLEQAEVE